MRLIKQDDIENFDRQMNQFRDELTEAVGELDKHFDPLRSAAKERLGSLYDQSDYPATLIGLFAVEWDFPAVEPPDHLRRLNPQLFEQERQRIASRFDEAVRLAEEAFTAEFSKLVCHLVERLGSNPGGEKKVFRDSAVQNLRDFFDRFKSLSVGSNADLDQLVEQAQSMISGIDPQAVRDSDSLRQQLGSQLTAVQSVLDGLLVDQPRRRLLRQGRSDPGIGGPP